MVANANMKNLYDQGRASPSFQRKGVCHVQSREMETWWGGGTITLCKHLIGPCTREGEKLL